MKDLFDISKIFASKKSQFDEKDLIYNKYLEPMLPIFDCWCNFLLNLAAWLLHFSWGVVMCSLCQMPFLIKEAPEFALSEDRTEYFELLFMKSSIWFWYWRNSVWAFLYMPHPDTHFQMLSQTNGQNYFLAGNLTYCACFVLMEESRGHRGNKYRHKEKMQALERQNTQN